MQRSFVEFSKHYNFKYYTNNVKNDNNFEGNASENNCRKRRIDYFQEICQFANISHIVTAHHLDDCVESYLLNCFRGQPAFQPMKLIGNFSNFQILHPFLLSQKKALEQFVNCYKDKIGYASRFVVNDDTNLQIKGSRRNWIRNIIIPNLRKQQINLQPYCRERIMEQINEMNRL